METDISWGSTPSNLGEAEKTILVRLSTLRRLEAVSSIEPENAVISGTVMLSPDLTVFLKTITVLARVIPLMTLDSMVDSMVMLSLLDGPVLSIKLTEFVSEILRGSETERRISYSLPIPSHSPTRVMVALSINGI